MCWKTFFRMYVLNPAFIPLILGSLLHIRTSVVDLLVLGLVSEEDLPQAILTLSLELWLLTILMQQVTHRSHVQRCELSLLWSDQCQHNLLLQLYIVLWGERHFHSEVILMFTHNFLVYAALRYSYALFTQVRPQKWGRIAIVAGVLAHVCHSGVCLKTLGQSKLLVMHYEGVLILCDWALSLEKGVLNKYKRKTIELLVQIIQWSHLTITFAELLPSNLCLLFVLLKIQQFIFAFSNNVNSQRALLKAIDEFLALYSPKTLENPESCGICLRDIEGEGYPLICTHVYHLQCISKWLSLSADRRCPLCRRVFLSKTTDQSPLNFTNLLDSVFNVEEYSQLIEGLDFSP